MSLLRGLLLTTDGPGRFHRFRSIAQRAPLGSPACRQQIVRQVDRHGNRRQAADFHAFNSKLGARKCEIARNTRNAKQRVTHPKYTVPASYYVRWVKRSSIVVLLSQSRSRKYEFA